MARSVTLVEVADRAGVSPSTASLAFKSSGSISMRTRERILRAAEELGYAGPNAAASSLKSGRSGVIGILITDRIQPALRSPVMLATFDGLAEVLDENGFAPLLLPIRDTASSRSGVLHWPIEAAAILSRGEPFPDLIRSFVARGIPIVGVESAPGSGAPIVDIDHYGGMVTLAEHLRSAGHRRVGVVMRARHAAPRAEDDRFAAPGPIDADLGQIENQAILKRLQAVAAVFPDAVKIEAAGRDSEAGKAAALRLLDAAPGLTAIIAQSDILAVGAINAVESLGMRVPADISVTGFDGISIDGFERQLTTVLQPLSERGRVAGRVLVDLLAGREVEDIVLPTRYRAGDTSGPVAADRRW